MSQKEDAQEVMKVRTTLTFDAYMIVGPDDRGDVGDCHKKNLTGIIWEAVAPTLPAKGLIQIEPGEVRYRLVSKGEVVIKHDHKAQQQDLFVALGRSLRRALEHRRDHGPDTATASGAALDSMRELTDEQVGRRAWSQAISAIAGEVE